MKLPRARGRREAQTYSSLSLFVRCMMSLVRGVRYQWAIDEWSANSRVTVVGTLRYLSTERTFLFEVVHSVNFIRGFLLSLPAPVLESLV